MDLKTPAKMGFAVLGLGMIGVVTLENSLNLTTVLAIALHLLLFASSVILAAYTFRKGHDDTPLSPQWAPKIVRAAIPYRSRTILLTSGVVLLLVWLGTSLTRFTSSERELTEIERTLSHGLENSDQAVVLTSDESKGIFETKATLIRGAGATWLKFFLGIEARHRLPPHETEILFYSAGSSEKEGFSSLLQEGLTIFPIGTEGHFVSSTLKDALEQIQETRVIRLIGLSATSHIQLYSLALFLICFIATLKHQEDRAHRDLLFSEAENLLRTSKETGEITRASLWSRLLCMEPFLCEFHPHTSDQAETSPIWVSYRLGKGSRDRLPGVLIRSEQLPKEPRPIRKFIKSLPRHFFVSTELSKG